MKLSSQKRAAVATVWSIAVVLELIKGELLFAAVAAVLSVALWDSYRRDKRRRAQRVPEHRSEV